MEKWCVVTGGRGFAARHLVEMLIRSDKWWVRIADLGPTIKLEPEEEEGVVGDALRSGRAVYVSADLRNPFQVIKAFNGAEVVFHMAAPDSSINSYQLHYSVNVEGTKNVIDACVECKVKRLIYTSSPSVVFDGIHGIFDGMESLPLSNMPYPDKFNDSYSETKAEGEKLVIKANGRNGLLTCCIRPSSIFGPGDKLLVPSLASAAKAGKSKYIGGDGNNLYDFTYVKNVSYGHVCAERTLASGGPRAKKAAGQYIVGDGNNLYDFTYVENVAYGHVCAERTLASGGPRAEKAAGQAYFITNNEPIKLWEFVSLIVEGLGYKRPSIKIPVSVMMPIARLVEFTYELLAPFGMRVPQLTPSRIRLLTCNRTFSCTKARVQLDYEPIVPLKEGLKRTINAYSHLRAVPRSGASKTSMILGTGNIANVLLWKDKKQTLIALLILATLYYYLVAFGYTFITAVAKLLSLTALFLFVHSLVPAKILGITFEKIPPSCYHLSDEKAHQIACSVASSWSSAVRVLKSLCKGKDWPLFFKVVAILLFLSFLGATSLQSIFKIGVPLGFVTYEKWEDEIDELSCKAASFILKVKSDAIRKFRRH